MTEYLTGLDRMFAIEANSPEEAEAKLAERLNQSGITIAPNDCVVYEEIPDGV